MEVKRRKKQVGEDAVVAPAAGAMSSGGILGTKSPDDGYMDGSNFLLPARVKTSPFRRDLLPKRKKLPLVGRVQLAEEEAAAGWLSQLKPAEVLAAVQACFPEATRVEAAAWCPASGKLFAKAAAGKRVAFVELSVEAGGKLYCSPKARAMSATEAKQKSGGRIETIAVS